MPDETLTWRPDGMAVIEGSHQRPMTPEQTKEAVATLLANYDATPKWVLIDTSEPEEREHD